MPNINKILLLSSTLGTALALPFPTQAHHAFAAEFTVDRPVEFTGTVTKVEMINPHSWIHLDIVNEAGETESWMIEGGSPNALFRQGITRNSIPVGSELSVVGYQARDGAHRAVGRTIQFSNGEPLFFSSTRIPPSTTE